MTRLYQHSLDTGETPTDWKNAFVVPIFKKGEKHVPSNYRPVSLTSIACKVLEHVVHSSVMRHFDKNQILTDKQHGFRARRSCETLLISTIQEIARNMTQKGQVDVILLDFAKAFDKSSPATQVEILWRSRFHSTLDRIIFEPRKRLFCWMAPSLLKLMYCLVYRKAPSSDRFSSWHLSTTYQSLQNTQMPDCLRTTASSTDMSRQAKTKPSSRKTNLHWRDGKKPGK